MGQQWSGEEEDSLEALEEAFKAHFELLRPVSHRLFNRFEVKPFGVLGIGESTPGRLQAGSQINAVVVDTTSPMAMLTDKPQSARGASKAVTDWIGLSASGARYPKQVRDHFLAPNGEVMENLARYNCYGPGQHVVHVMGPVLREMEQSIEDLTEAYANILTEFARALGFSPSSNNASNLPSSYMATYGTGQGVPPTLRLPPISTGGLLANKALASHLGRIFWSSLAIALERLPLSLQRRLNDVNIEVCIFKASELSMFSGTREIVSGGVQLDHDCGKLKPRDGGWGWVRKANGPADRLERIAATNLTMQAIWCKGYYLPTGRAVPLKHIDTMVANTVVKDAGNMFGSNSPPASPGRSTVLSFAEGTVMEAAVKCANEGRLTAAVNAASAYHVGGGVLSGGRHALEESWCITSTLLKSLQEAHFMTQTNDEEVCGEYQVHTNAAGHRFHRYLPEDSVVISPTVEIFRDGYRNGYSFLKEACVMCGIISVAMYNRNPKMKDCPVDAPSDTKAYQDGIRRRLRAVVLAAAETGAELLVCPDIGCGVYGNHPAAVGTQLGLVLREPEVAGLLAEVVIAGNRDFFDAANRALDTGDSNATAVTWLGGALGCGAPPAKSDGSPSQVDAEHTRISPSGKREKPHSGALRSQVSTEEQSNCTIA